MIPVRIQPLLEHRPRTRLRRWMPILLVLFLIAAAWHGWNMRRARSAAGLYLMPDGISYVVLKPGFFPALQVSDGYIWALALSPNPGMKIGLHASGGGDRIVLKQVQTAPEQMPGGSIARIKNTIVLRLNRSTKTPGDWDLASAGLTLEGNDVCIAAISGNWQAFSAPPKRGVVKDFIERFLSRLRMRVYMTGELEPSETPVPSFLHRARDARLASYCHNRLREPESDSDLEMLRQLGGEGPPDMILGLHLVALEAQQGNLEESQEAWEKWNAAYGASAHPFLRSMALRTQKVLDTAKWRKQYPALTAFWDQILPDIYRPRLAAGTLPEYLDWLRNAGKCDLLNSDTKRLVPFSLSQPIPVPNFLEIQILSKVTRVQASFALLQGDTRSSLGMLTGVYWLGQSLNTSDVLVGRLLGIAARAIAIGGLEQHVLDGCETSAELRTAWDALERLAHLPGQETGASILDREYGLVVAHMKILHREFIGNIAKDVFFPRASEHAIRHRVCDAKFDVLRTAVAARYRLLTAGAFPGSPAEFGPLLPGGPLADCFATSAPLRFLSKPDGFHIYSVGPDGRDDKAAIPYDPTNGTTSRGDLAVRIPREREYPFPAGGVRVNTAAELLKMFPKGLPPDPFADTRGRPLSIIASSEADWKSCALPGVKTAPAPTPSRAPAPSPKPGSGETGRAPAPAPPPAPPTNADAPTTPTPVVIFSFGPDVDESEYVAFPRLTGEDMFTTWSAPSTPLQLVFPPASARLQLVVPSADSASVPPPPPPPPPGLVQGPLGVGRARAAAGMINSPYPGFPFGNPAAGPLMEPSYDPTNGTTSNGNLYLKIPRSDAAGR